MDALPAARREVSGACDHAAARGGDGVAGVHSSTLLQLSRDGQIENRGNGDGAQERGGGGAGVETNGSAVEFAVRVQQQQLENACHDPPRIDPRQEAGVGKTI